MYRKLDFGALSLAKDISVTMLPSRLRDPCEREDKGSGLEGGSAFRNTRGLTLTWTPRHCSSMHKTCTDAIRQHLSMERGE